MKSQHTILAIIVVILGLGMLMHVHHDKSKTTTPPASPPAVATVEKPAAVKPTVESPPVKQDKKVEGNT